MKQFNDALPACLLAAAKQTVWPTRLAKGATAGWLPLLLLLIAVLSSAVQAGAQTGNCTTPGFYQASSFVVGNNPVSVATGDFNGDGGTDIATANYGSQNVSVLLYVGPGLGFSVAFNTSLGTDPVSITTGDFNGDGKLDLVTANANSSDVSLLLGNGAGGFTAPSNFGIGTDAVSVTTGDFNGDGKADIATANVFSSLSVLLGNGAGGFEAPLYYTAGAVAVSITTGDFDGDGKPDLATANAGSDNVSVLLGDGTGNFAAAVKFVTDDGPRSITTGDFNKDGKLDIATANFGSDNVSVLLGNGAGSFAATTNFGVGTDPVSVTRADFNGDGRLDLATANYGSNNVSVLPGDGAGGFATATNFSIISNPQSLTTADIDRDGKIDIVTANAGNTVSVPINSCSSSCPAINFTTAANFGAGINPRSVTIGDFNGDGKADMATANAGSNNVSVSIGDGTGGFAAALNFGVVGSPRSVTTGDFNGDGKLDIATSNFNSNTVSVLLSNGTGGFAATNFGVGREPESITTGDFNGDGRPDLVTANFLSRNLSVLLSNSTGSFATAISFGAGTSARSITTGDFNGDGRLDLAVPNFLSSNVSLFLGNGTGGFAATAANYATGNGPYSIITGDFNRDGKPDIATTNSSSNNVSILLNNGTGGFAGAVNYGVGSFPYAVTTGDFNNDGRLDLAAANFNTDNVSMLAGDGAGSFAASVNFSTGDGPYSVATGDFNRDGKLDLVTANYNAGNVSVLLNACGIATPVITASGPTTFCAGNSVVLSVQASFASYSWSNGATTQSITVTTSGSYIVTVTNIGGATSPASDPVAVVVNALPATPTVSVSQPACSATTGTITVNTPTGSDITYSIDNANYQADNVFRNVAPGSYHVTAKNSSGCISSSIPVTIDAQPATPAKPVVSTMQPTCTTATGTITVNTPTGSDITYSINGTDYQVSPTFSSVAPGSYHVTARNSSSCTSLSSDEIKIIAMVDKEAPVITCPATQQFCYSSTGTYTIPALSATDNCGIPGTSFVVSGATTRSGTGNNASGAFAPGTSTISWTVKDAANNVSTCSTMVMVNSQLLVSIPDSKALNSNGVMVNTVYVGYAPASSITLTATASGGSGTYTYLWSNGATTKSITVSPANTTIYTVTVRNGNSCSATTSKQVKVTDVRCGNKLDKVSICHNGNTLCISDNAVDIHLNHSGDMLGECGNGIVAGRVATSTAINEEETTVTTTSASVYPNPNKGQFNLRFGTTKATRADVQILNIQGAIVHTKTVQTSSKTQTVQLSIPNPVAGTYLVKIISEEGVQILKVLVQP